MENGNKGAFATANNRNHQEGLSKREYFAGLAMQGMLSNPEYRGDDKIFCKRAIELADELLKQLEQ